MVTPSGAQVSEPSPIPMAMGNIPNMEVRAVMITGRKRDLPATAMASLNSRPRSRIKLIKSTSTTPFLTTIPTNITNPMAAIILRLVPVMKSATATPVKAKGTENMMTNGLE